MEQFQKAIRKVRQVQRMRKQRGYAFSQGDEGQMRLIRAYDTTQHRGKYGEMKAVPHNAQQNRGLGGYVGARSVQSEEHCSVRRRKKEMRSGKSNEPCGWDRGISVPVIT